MTDAQGQVTSTRSYTPWGEVLEQSGQADLAAGYLGGMLDAATGLIYVGNGQYYDPATGRFLTRNANPTQTNPYVPWQGDPAGAMLAPLAVLAMAYGRKKKRSKWDNLVIVTVLCLTAGMALSACTPSTTVTVDPPPTGTPVPTSKVTATITPTTVTVTATPTATSAPTTAPAITCIFTPTPAPTKPADLDPKYADVWTTYVHLWNKQDEEAWWWVDSSGNRSFTPLDFLDRLFQFELERATKDTKTKPILAELAVGNFCFWDQRVSKDDWSQKPGPGCQRNPSDKEVLEYIGKRGILFSGYDEKTGKYIKDFRVLTPDGMRTNWIRWDIDHPDYQEIPYAQSFRTADDAWLDWRNAKNDGAVNDVPVEWGNNIDGFNASFYKNVHDKRIGGAFGRKTREVVADMDDNFYAFTFCQYVYYSKPGIYTATDAIPTAHCDDDSHWPWTK